jgi:hypothetical protein
MSRGKQKEFLPALGGQNKLLVIIGNEKVP